MSNLNWKIGDVSVTRVEERIHGTIRESLIPGITVDDIREHEAWAGQYFSSSGRLLLSVHSFIVQTPDRMILVDTCAGPASKGPLEGDAQFLSRLEASIPGGLEAIDVVLCTHLHFDHVGWNTRVLGERRVPTFPNARYLFAREELDAVTEHDSFEIRETSIEPLIEAGQVDLVTRDHQICSEIRLIPTPGHTPGHVSVVIESRSEVAVITGDLIHTPLQFALPQHSAEPFDWDSNIATKTRRQFIADRLDSDELILGTHFPPPTAGWIRTDGNRVIFLTDRNDLSTGD